MAFLPCHSELAPLFQLLDRPTRTRTHARTRTFTPAFDVRELPDGYYLDGELPGVDQSQIDIEFSDSHTLVIKGRTDRHYNEHQHQHEHKDTSGSSPRYHATVEDESDGSSSESDSSVHSAPDQPSQAVPDSVQPPSARYWASERSTGQFQRTFTFATRVDQDAVRANLKNGILSLVVPKETAPQSKKIRIE